MSGYNVLLFLHVLGAIVWLGGGVVLVLMALQVRGSTTGTQTFANVLPYIGIRMFMPAVLVVLVTGVWMVLADSAWSFGQAWVLIALGLFVVAFLVGGVYLSRIGIALDRAAKAASGELPVLVNRWLAGYAVVIVVLLLVVADMVFKPGIA